MGLFGESKDERNKRIYQENKRAEQEKRLGKISKAIQRIAELNPQWALNVLTLFNVYSPAAGEIFLLKITGECKDYIKIKLAISNKDSHTPGPVLNIPRSECTVDITQAQPNSETIYIYNGKFWRDDPAGELLSNYILKQAEPFISKHYCEISKKYQEETQRRKDTEAETQRVRDNFFGKKP